MKTISAGLDSHLSGGTTTLASCWKATLRNGTVYGFTDHSDDIVFEGVTYLAASGFTASAVDSQTKLAVDNFEVTGLLSSPAITVADMNAGLWDFAEIRIFQVNWKDTSQGSIKLMRGHLGEISASRGTFKAEMRGLADAFSQSVGDLYGPSCRADFGDAECGINLASWTVTGTVTSVSSDGLVIFDTSRTEPGPASPKVITAITKAANAQVTASAHGFTAGQVVYIANVSGMVEINGFFYVVKTVVNANNFTVSVDSSAFSTYTSGGNVSSAGNAGYFDYGKITFTSGLNNGLSMEVKAYSVGTIGLQLSMPYTVAVGDTYSMHAGCGKRFTEDCVARFANGINFRGEPHLPGMDKVLAYARR